jgi:hypothetical protein
VIASPATGVGGKIVRLFDRAKPPPLRIVESYRGRVDVQAGRAIKVLDARMAAHITWTLWVAPTKDGGFCTSPGSCYPPHVRPDYRLNLGVCLCGRVAQDGEILAPPGRPGRRDHERAGRLAPAPLRRRRESVDPARLGRRAGQHRVVPLRRSEAALAEGAPADHAHDALRRRR